MKCASMKEVIDQAIEFEMKTAEFYSKAADFARNEDAETMLRALRSQEAKHVKLLMDFNPSEHRELPGIFRVNFTPESFVKDFEIDESDRPAIICRKVILFERKSCKFFQTIARTVDEANVSEFFTALSNLELRHIEIIQNELTSYYQ